MSKYSQIPLGKDDKDKAHLTVVKNETSEKKFLTLRELSAEYNIPYGTIRAWATERKFPMTKLPYKRIRVKRSKFEKWLEKYHIPENGGLKL